MARTRMRSVVQRGYDSVHLALWSLLIAGVICFAAFVVPNLPKTRALYEAQRAAQIEAEHDFYCRRWRMVPGSGMYQGCMSDLQQFRHNVEQRLADDANVRATVDSFLADLERQAGDNGDSLSSRA